ncbi:flocculation protein FLO11-like isoform X2 [Arachis stenosperma]|uniref:flocculation protein FLO11-like isoform X2 n=1 Tax=Arachis stenosperma TaxID=217475 RepID=UPI0025AD726F|nr:flocculation protein FLO11-like isoform X2 [Arachis stenosperma]
MPEKSRKVPFTEQDSAKLLERYDATTVLTLLQELAHYPHAKIDWNELVKNTSTGISTAREYQMVWRHLAYRHALAENLEDGAQPLDDDSDLECELEVLPPVSAEAVSEAAACMKVMIASRTLSESTPSSSTIEAPLTITVPVCRGSGTPSGTSQSSKLMQGTNVIFPVTVQRQTLPTAPSTDGVETKGLGGGNMASKRKRKAWSEEEDIQLRAAVQRFGEGNWANMAKGDNFPIKRSPTQLAQRWSILRKKDGTANSGTIVTSTTYTTAEQLATRHSLSLALDMPFKKLTAPGTADQAKTSLTSKTQVQHTTTATTIQSSLQPHQQSMLRGNPTPNPALKATAVAVGARVVSQSNIASQIKVAQARNAVPGTSISLAKPSTSAGMSSESEVQARTSSSVAHVPPQFVRIPSQSAPAPSQSTAPITSPLSCSSTVKVASSTVPVLPEKDKPVTPTLVVNKVPIKQEVNTTDELRNSKPSPAPKEMVQNDEKSTQDKSMNIPVKERVTSLVGSTRKEEVAEDKAAPKNQVKSEDDGNKGSHELDKEKSKISINGRSQDQKMDEKQENLQN